MISLRVSVLIGCKVPPQHSHICSVSVRWYSISSTAAFPVFLFWFLFLDADFSEKEADLVYRLKIKGQDVIFYLLMELQSSVDYQMPYRLLLYMVEIWRDVLKNIPSEKAVRKDFRLPPIIPITLYNGRDKWTACRSFKETLAEAELFTEYIVSFKYILIDVNRYHKQTLLDLANLIGAVFLLDQEIDSKEYRNRLLGIVPILRSLILIVFNCSRVG